jgi:S1-C subfamily serine protease
VIRFYNLAVESGVLVQGVEKESPAEKSGLREGDVLVAYAGNPISTVDHLHRILSEEQIGRPSDLTVIRTTEKLTLTIIPVPAHAQ